MPSILDRNHIWTADDNTARTMDRRGEQQGLSLGWLLVLAIGGGILLFAAIGLLLSWRIKARAEPCTTRVYAQRDGEASDADRHLGTSSTTRLLKRRFMASQSSLGQFSRRLSMTNLSAPVLPPLPTYSGVGARRPSRTWVDEEAMHGPRVNPLGLRESWFGRDSWLRRVPTLPDLDGDNETKGEELKDRPEHQHQEHDRDDAYEDRQQREQRQDSYQPRDMEEEQRQLEVQKTRTRPSLTMSKTAPELFKPDESPRGRSREVAPKRSIRPVGPDLELRDILQLTEERLREGNSRSPTKTAKSSPIKASPTKRSSTQSSPTKSIPTKPSPAKTAGTRTGGSPGKCTPTKGSPTKSVLTKTPQSFRTAPISLSSPGGSQGRKTPSPAKRSGSGAGTPTATPKGHTRNASTISISSAAYSLLNLAAQELQLPGGAASPSQLARGREWEAQQGGGQQRPTSTTNMSPQRMPRQQAPSLSLSPQRRRRSRSLDSDASSSLSTLYSVGEPEDPRPRRQCDGSDDEDDDPFVESSSTASPRGKQAAWEVSRQQPTGPRPLRRTKTLSVAALPAHVDASAVPEPLRTISVNSRLGRVSKDGSVVKANSRRFSLLLQPPKPTAQTTGQQTRPKSDMPTDSASSRLPETDSEASMVSVSVHTDESTILSRDEDAETPRRGWATPTRSGERQSDEIASSPMNEKELLSMLLTGSGGRRRDLPKPPSTRILVNEDPYVSTALSPRPKSQGRQPSEVREHGHQQRPTGLSRRHSLMSTSSSNYDLEEGFSGIPESDSVADLPRRNASGGLGPQHSVGSTVAELRRMNSFVSSYSVASVASTYFSAAGGGGGGDDAATLPAMRGGGFSPSRSNSKNALAASRNYLGLNATKNKGASTPQQQQQQQQQQQRQPGSGTPTLVVLKDQSTGTGKENENVGLGLSSMPADRSSTIEVGHVRRGQTNLMVPSAGDVPRETRGLAAATNSSKRESVETLGLYDKDGFLLNSPERDALGKSGQLRM